MTHQNIIGNWCRKCPTCNGEIEHKGYNNKASSKFYDKLKKECRSCCRKGERCYNFGKHHSDERKKKIGLSNLGKTRTEEQKRKYSEIQSGKKSFWYGKKHSSETKQKMSKVHIGIKFSRCTKEKLSKKKIGKNNPMYGKNFTKKHREKLRIAILKGIEKRGRTISYNSKACEFIDKLNKKNGWNLQHALNGGEVKIIGYSLDGYDKEKNIVFEYDEKHHRREKKRKKDLIRQNNIINEIKPYKFIRYEEWNNRLYDAVTNIDIIT